MPTYWEGLREQASNTGNSQKHSHHTIKPDISYLLNQLFKVKKTGSDRWLARCPAHDDRNPSLAIRDCNGTVLLKCFAGCNAHEIVSAIGMNLSDLFPLSDDPKYIKQTRQGFSAWQLLNALKTDLTRLLIIANDLKKNDLLSVDDHSFVSEVILRLNDGLQYLEGAR
jgi:hypothetical protein